MAIGGQDRVVEHRVVLEAVDSDAPLRIGDRGGDHLGEVGGEALDQIQRPGRGSGSTSIP
jgi:hypothetical protein